MIQRQLRNSCVNITPQPLIRISSYDIRNFRKKLGITQEVFAQILTDLEPLGKSFRNSAFQT